MSTTSPITLLSRSREPSTERSASRLWGGRRSGTWGSAMFHLPVGGRRDPSPSLFLLGHLHHGHLHLGLDVVAEVELHGIETRFLDVPFELHHLGVDRHSLG